MEDGEVERVLAVSKHASRRAQKEARREARLEWRKKNFRELTVFLVVTVVLLCLLSSLEALVIGGHTSPHTKLAVTGIFVAVVIGLDFLTFAMCFWGD